MNNLFNNNNLLRLLVKWKVHFAVTALLAVGLSTVISGPTFIRPKYKAVAVIYPSNLISYGIETPAEQMLQLFQSSQIRDSIIKKFRLAERYDADTTTSAGRNNLQETYNDNVKVVKTEYEAVKMEVWDESPETASRIAYEITNQFNVTTRILQREKSKEVAHILEDQLRKKQEDIDSIDKGLKVLKIKYGILDYDAQAKAVSKEYYKNIGSGGQKMNELTTAIRNLEEKGSEYVALDIRLREAVQQYAKLKIDYDNAIRDVRKHLTYINFVIKPDPPNKKSYPIRWLIVVFATIGTLFFAFVVISFYENKKQ